MSLERVESKFIIPLALVPPVLQFVNNQDIITLSLVNKFFSEEIKNYHNNKHIKKIIDHLGFLLARCLLITDNRLREVSLKKKSQREIEKIYTDHAKTLNNILFTCFISGYCSAKGVLKEGEEMGLVRLMIKMGTNIENHSFF